MSLPFASRILIFSSMTRINISSSIMCSFPNVTYITSRSIITNTKYFLLYAYSGLAIVNTYRTCRLWRTLHEKQQDRRWTLVQFRQSSVAGEVFLARFYPLRHLARPLQIHFSLGSRETTHSSFPLHYSSGTSHKFARFA